MKNLKTFKNFINESKINENKRIRLDHFLESLPTVGEFRLIRYGKLTSVYTFKSFFQSIKDAKLQPNDTNHGFEYYILEK